MRSRSIAATSGRVGVAAGPTGARAASLDAPNSNLGPASSDATPQQKALRLVAARAITFVVRVKGTSDQVALF